MTKTVKHAQFLVSCSTHTPLVISPPHRKPASRFYPLHFIFRPHITLLVIPKISQTGNLCLAVSVPGFLPQPPTDNPLFGPSKLIYYTHLLRKPFTHSVWKLDGFLHLLRHDIAPVPPSYAVLLRVHSIIMCHGHVRIPCCACCSFCYCIFIRRVILTRALAGISGARDLSLNENYERLKKSCTEGRKAKHVPDGVG